MLRAGRPLLLLLLLLRRGRALLLGHAVAGRRHLLHLRLLHILLRGLRTHTDGQQLVIGCRQRVPT